ncbi:inositol 1,4,5-triphosphate receptor associated 2 [Acanthopagrus latus]|uniref:inositol 1,4,5-triphosphate receptor associated 2 n=1 Tax=Acanthopagrus latus TaxID=8177 RepID=UPI00187BF0E1|nr:inositol 1,4,5-triphosphate receptor associated 2 [Acanthopagrus latus]
MSEKDLESAFAQIAMAFRCDQYTLKQRLQAEEHDRNLAEENVQLELTRGRETLETLKGLCMDSKRSKILQRLELSLDILGGTVERISNTAEVLGAVHQEARVSRAVELMVAHVDNLTKRHDRNMAELEEAKKAIQQQNPCRTITDPRASPDPDDSDSRRRSYQQSNSRRRVSISVISSNSHEKIMRQLRKRAKEGGSSDKKSGRSQSVSSESSCSAINTADDRPPDPEEAPPEASAAQPPPEPPATPTPECLPSKQPATKKTQNKNSSLDTLRHRHKGRSALSKKKADRDRKTTNLFRRLSVGTYGPSCRQHPLAHWLHRCRWALFCVYLCALICVVTLTYFLLEAS